MNDNVLILGAILSLIFAQVIKHKLRKKEKETKEIPLAGGNKVAVFVAAILNPIAADIFFYFGWKKSFTKMAKSANKICWIIFGVEVVVGILLAILFINMGWIEVPVDAVT